MRALHDRSVVTRSHCDVKASIIEAQMKTHNTNTCGARTSRAPENIRNPRAFLSQLAMVHLSVLNIPRAEPIQIIARRTLAAIGWRLPLLVVDLRTEQVQP
jgi:hypothetical protein